MEQYLELSSYYSRAKSLKVRNMPISRIIGLRPSVKFFENSHFQLLKESVYFSRLPILAKNVSNEQEANT